VIVRGAGEAPAPLRVRRSLRRRPLRLPALPPIGLAVAAVTLLAGCGHPVAARSGGGTTKSSAPVLVAGRGGTATVALPAIPTTLNDHTVAGDTEATRLVASAVWVQVFQIGPKLVPQLDTSVIQSAEVVSVDPQIVVYQIAPVARWSDGVPVSAADFQYAWQSQRGGATDVDGQPDSVASTLGYRDIQSVTASNGGRTVTVTFRTPYADWESLFDDLLPAHIAEQVGWNNGFDHFDPRVLVSAGPWVIKQWIPGQEVVLARNPRWSGAAPRLRQVVLEAVDSPAAWERDMAGQRVQVAGPSTFDATLLSELSSLPTTETETQLGTTMLQLDFNTRRPPLDQTDVRLGIAHEIDRAGMVSSVALPLYRYASMDNSHLFANLQPRYSDNAAAFETVDTATGNLLLSTAGLVRDPVGTWTLHGAPLTLSLTWADDDPWSAAVGPLVAAQLVAAGFDVTTAPVSGATLLDSTLPSGAFDLAIVPLPASAFPSQLAGAFSTAADTGNPDLPHDWSGFDDPKIDALFTQAQSELSASQADATYQQIDQDLWLEMPTFPLLAEPNLVAFSASMDDVSADPGGLGVLWNMSDWAVLVPAPSNKKASNDPSGHRASMRSG
jgi:peptide/nickel transport system substrate-binding protein